MRLLAPSTTTTGLRHNGVDKTPTPALKNWLDCPNESPGFYHANHLIIKITVQTTPQATACYPPKKPGICHGLFFCLQAYTLK
jgi:hypothetical protein